MTSSSPPPSSAGDDGSTPTIRPATAEDAPRCAAIAVAAWRCVYQGWRELLGESLWERNFGDWEERKRGSVMSQLRDYPDAAICTEISGEVVGFLTWRLDRDRLVGEISNNAVMPPYQNRGIGTAQVRHALEVFEDEGMKAARVLTGGDDGHAPARAMYRAAGFERTIPYVEYFLEL